MTKSRSGRIPNGRRHGKSLLRLTAQALALPGICGSVLAAEDDQDATLSYRYSNYSEDDLPADQVLAGSNKRYEIDIHQARVDAPLSDRFRITLDVSREAMSGASPQGFVQAEGLAPILMSGATIVEARNDMQLGGRYSFDRGNIGAQIYRSSENDYLSRGGGLSFDYDFNEKLTTLSSSFSIYEDDLNPTDALLFGRIEHAEKSLRSLAVSVSQVLDKNSKVNFGVSVTRLTGYLSDPYKFDDSRPELNTQWAFSAAYRHYFIDRDASLHLDFRYYRDQFGVRSQTLDLAWYQPLGVIHQLVPSLRYYNQGKADFWMAADFSAEPGDFRSSDFRLSEFGAFAVGLKWIVKFKRWDFIVSGERYLSSGGLALGTVEDESPALVDFSRVTAGFDFRF